MFISSQSKELIKWKAPSIKSLASERTLVPSAHSTVSTFYFIFACDQYITVITDITSNIFNIISRLPKTFPHQLLRKFSVKWCIYPPISYIWHIGRITRLWLPRQATWLTVLKTNISKPDEPATERLRLAQSGVEYYFNPPMGERGNHVTWQCLPGFVKRVSPGYDLQLTTALANWDRQIKPPC